MALYDRTAESTFDRVSIDLAHEPFVELAAALRARVDSILKRWRKVSLQAMPHLDALTLDEFENTIVVILGATADALESSDPRSLRGLIDEAPAHGVTRFAQKHSLLDLFEEDRVLRGVIITELAAEMQRPLEVGEAATFHALFDVLIQQGVMALVHKQGEQLREVQQTTRDMNEQLLAGAIRQEESLERARKSEYALRQSEERYRSLVSVLTDVSWVTDATGAFVSPQPPWEAFTGQTWDAHRGFGWLDAVHPEDRERIKAAWRMACERRSVYRADGRLWHAPSQHWRHFSVKATAVIDPQGDVRVWVGASTDVEDATQMRLDRERLLDGERAARTEAEHANRLKDEFLATLSHEIRTPLNAILGWVRLIERNPADLDTMREGIPVISRNAKAQMDLIADLLDMSGILSGKVRLELKEMDLSDAVRTAIDSIRPAADAKGIKIEAELSCECCNVCGDLSRLQQVCWNLLSNAAKFTPTGGCIRVALEREESQARLTISDTGMGIAPEFLPHLFQRFRQADASTTRKHGGLGLGLSIVKQLVELHGGTISAESPGIGQGATFTVELPLHSPIASGQEALGPACGVVTDLELSGIRILAIDDQLDARNLIKRVLADRGAEVITAESGKEGLQQLESHEPDVVLCDIGMPGMDGYEFVREMRRLGHETPAICVTAFARPKEKERAVRAGFQAHLVKPVEPAELVSAIAVFAKLRLGGRSP